MQKRNLGGGGMNKKEDGNREEKRGRKEKKRDSGKCVFPQVTDYCRLGDGHMQTLQD